MSERGGAGLPARPGGAGCTALAASRTGRSSGLWPSCCNCVIPIACSRMSFRAKLSWRNCMSAKLGHPDPPSNRSRAGHCKPACARSCPPHLLPTIWQQNSHAASCRACLAFQPSGRGAAALLCALEPSSAHGVQSRCPRPLVAAGVTPAGGGLPRRQGALAMQCTRCTPRVTRHGSGQGSWGRSPSVATGGRAPLTPFSPHTPSSSACCSWGPSPPRRRGL